MHRTTELRALLRQGFGLTWRQYMEIWQEDQAKEAAVNNGPASKEPVHKNRPVKVARVIQRQGK